MAETTNIAWADGTFNPWIGCTKVGPGCDHCYAELLDKNRFSHTLGGGTATVPIVHWGVGAPRYRTAVANWRKPILWDRKARESGKPFRVFCASLADVFDNDVPDEWRADLWRLIYATPNLTWMLLTKRIGNVPAMLPERWLIDYGHPPQNVWVGITVVNQAEADRDIPKLLAIKAAVRFLSIEPQLGPIDFRTAAFPPGILRNGYPAVLPVPWIDWVIVGGESGHQARPFDVDWARSTVRACKAAGVAVFVKQMGSHTVTHGMTSPGGHWPAGTIRNDTGHGHFRVMWKDRAGADPTAWPEDLRVQEFPK